MGTFALMLAAISYLAPVSYAEDAAQADETLPDMVKAGIVVSITEDFLQRGQNELLAEFVEKVNRIGYETTYELPLSDYDPAYDGEDTEISFSMLKIVSTGNLITDAEKTIDLDAECACIRGTIGTVDKVDLVFDYRIKDERGSVEMTIFDMIVNY